MASRSRRASLTLIAMAVVAAVVVAILVVGGPPAVAQSAQRISVADGDLAVDTTLFVPETATSDTPAPAVLIAHGFGGSKQSVASDAVAAARAGYVVLTWSARGFGRSGGAIGLNAPDAEIADVSRLIDWLARRPEVVRDAADDPRVGMTGASYGGGASLLAAGFDDRIDAIVPVVAWHSLSSSLAPNAAVSDAPGVLKQQWAGLLFAAGSGRSGAAVCGRFSRAICDAYTASAERGRLTDQAVLLLSRSDPARVLDRIAAPTLLVQAEGDTLFPLEQAVANAAGIAAAGTETKLVWIPGGHDVGSVAGNRERVRALTRQWFDRWLRDAPIETGPVFEWADRAADRDRVADRLPEPASASSRSAAVGATRRTLRLSAPARLVDDDAVSGERAWTGPPGGVPAALTNLPGAAAVADLLPPTDIPGQHVAFQTAPLDEDLQILGAPTVRVALDGTDGQAVLFAKLLDVAPGGRTTLPQQAVAPARVTGLPATVELVLPTLAHRLPAGHRLRLVLAATDQAFANPVTPATTTASVGPDATLTVPTASIVSGARGQLTSTLLGVAALLAVVGAVAFGLARRRDRRPHEPADAADAVAVSGLRKAYADGKVAVDDIDLVVGRGQVFGLLGPNGAGKTTTLRMLLGLIMPTAGQISLLGHQVTPGHPVLRHVGALVEGPGFAPYLSGRANLVSWWRAGGRPLHEAGMDGALAVAALGDAIDRPVRTYSHGMRQRLAIAQALLGDPQLLVLDEPTDGLDPGQIRGMRDLLAGLATGGRTVLVSSHLLAEVEQVCTHVAVMDRGRVVASGSVAELAGDTRTVEIVADDQAAARKVLTGVLGEARVQVQGGGLLVDLDGREPPDLVDALVGAGIRVRAVTPRQRLEDAFLRLVEAERA